MQLLLNKLRQSLETETTMMSKSESDRKANDFDIKDLKKEISQTDTKSITARVSEVFHVMSIYFFNR